MTTLNTGTPPATAPAARTRDIAAMLRPRRIAVIGAADGPVSTGGAVLRNLLAGGFDGEIVPVHPRARHVAGLPARADIGALSPPADLVVVAVRAEATVDAIATAAASGHRRFLLLPGGFAEAGPEGEARDRALRGLAAAHGLSLIGPNCAGFVHLRGGARVAATLMGGLPPGGAIAVVSQSGAVAEEAIALANARGLPLGSVISIGNAADLDAAAFLAYFAGDPQTRSIALYVEALRDPRAFAAAARQARDAGKRIVALFGGTSAAGAAAAARHTGANARAQDIDDLCKQTGIVRAPNARMLMLSAALMAADARPTGRRVLVVTNSGGPGVLCADRLAALGLGLPVLPRALAEALRAALPAGCAVANPLDILADAREDRFGAALDLAAGRASGCDALMVIQGVPRMVDPQPIAARVAALAGRSGVPVMHALIGTVPGRAALTRMLQAAGVAVFDDVDDMAVCAALAMQG